MIFLFEIFQKQFSDLFGLAAEDETSGTVSRRGTSSRGRKAAPGKKDSSGTTNSSSNKKSQEPINNYSSEESSDVSKTFMWSWIDVKKFL